MRKNILFIILVFLSVFTIAQHTDKGRFIISVSSGINFSERDYETMNMLYSNQKSEYYNSEKKNIFKLNMQPEYGFFIKNRILLGLTSNLDIYTNRSDSDYYTSSGFGAGPLFRYYYYPIFKILPYIELKGSYNLYSSGSESSVTASNFQVVILAGSVGLAIPISKKVAFDVNVSYLNRRMKYFSNMDTTYKISHLSLKLGICMFLGSEEKSQI